MKLLDDYQKFTATTAIYPDAGTGNQNELNYLALGLVGEAGEVANKVKKIFRDHSDNHAGDILPVLQIKEAIAKELGDTLWYLARLAAALDEELSLIAHKNRIKLEARQNMGSLSGHGDDRQGGPQHDTKPETR